MKDINILHQRFSAYGSNAKEWLRKCVLLLPDIEKYEVWKEKGFSSIYEYAAKLASMSRGQVEDALRILKKIEDKPALLEVVRKKGINAVRPIVTIVSKSTEKYWAKKAVDLSRHELETFVRDTKYSEKIGKGATSSEITISLKLKKSLALKLQKMSNGDWNSLMEKFILLYEHSLETQKPEKKISPSDYVPKAIKTYVLKRSNGKCEFPNCTKEYKHLHHVDRFASKKEHDPDRIVALCEAHHQLAHRGLIEETESIADWTIRENPDYTNLNRYIDDKVEFYRRN